MHLTHRNRNRHEKSGVYAHPIAVHRIRSGTHLKPAKCHPAKVLFQFEYGNYAWGYRHHGWLIAPSGNLHCYDHPENQSFPDSTGTLSAVDMEQNLQDTDRICYRVAPEALKAGFSLLSLAAKGPVGEPVAEMLDAGSAVYAIYILNRAIGQYERILLQPAGDVRIDNQSQQAQKRCEWLRSIDQAVSQNL